LWQKNPGLGGFHPAVLLLGTWIQSTVNSRGRASKLASDYGTRVLMRNSMSSAPRWVTVRPAKLLKCGRSEKGYDTFYDTLEKPQPGQVIDNSGACD
jgi:hypothetical protein